MSRPCKPTVPLTPEQQQLAANNQGLAYKIAGEVYRYREYNTGSLVSFQDLVAEAILALCRAARLYNPKRINPLSGQPYAFSSYACQSIRQQVLMTIRQANLVHIPDPVVLDVTRREAGKATKKATPANVELGYRARLCRQLKTQGMGGDWEAYEHYAWQDAEIAEEHDILSRAVASLDARSRLVVEYRYGLNGRERLTLSEIGKRIGVTKERVRQIQKGAVAILREQLGKWKCFQEVG